LQEIPLCPLQAGSAHSDALSKPHCSSSAGQEDVTLLRLRYMKKILRILAVVKFCVTTINMHQSVKKHNSKMAVVLKISSTFGLNDLTFRNNRFPYIRHQNQM